MCSGVVPRATADHVDAPTGEFADHLTEGIGLHGIDRFTIDIYGQAGVGQNADGKRRALDQVLYRLTHIFRSGGAVHAEHINGKRLEGGERAGDIGAEEHAPTDIERDLRLQGDALAAVAEVLIDAVHRRFDLEDVLAGLEQQQVSAAFY